MALNHTVKGSVNYTVVGTPTIVDGVASGFSSSDNLYVDSPITSGTNSIEVGCKFTTGTISEQGVFGSNYNFSKYGFNINSDGPLRTGVRVSVGGTEVNKVLSSTLVLSANTTYYAIMSCSKSTHILTLKISTDNENWTSYSSDIGAFDNFVGAGRITAGYTQNGAFLGSVDLNGTYIKVDGSAYFGVCPVEVKHIDYGTSVKYIVNGSPTISNGVVSGFSASNYLQLSQNISNSSPFEYVVCFTPNSVSPISGDGIGIARIGDADFFIRSNSKLCVKYSDGSNQWITEPTILSANTKYWGKFTYDGTNVGISLSTDGAEYTTPTKQEKNPRNHTDIIKYGDISPSYQEFNGSIDLNNTYIKINGKLWFFRPVTNYLIKDDKLIWCDSGMYLSGPLSITDIVGSPTISGGIATGLNEYNYVQSTNDIDTSKPFELIIDFTLNSSEFTTNNEFVGKLANMMMYVMKGNKKFEIGLQNGGWLTSVTQMALGGSYKIKITYDQTDVKLYVDSGSGFNLESTYNAPAFTDIGPLKIGGWGAWNGSVDLNNTSCTCGQVIEGSLPVPSGFTYGTTTTTSAGFVDIVTQAFTAVQGATVVKDEA